MNRPLALAFLVAGFVVATSPVWALDAGNPNFSPDPALPGQTVSFTGTLPDSGMDPNVCEVIGADGATPTYRCEYDNAARFSGWVVVPTHATPGASDTMTFCGSPGC